MNPKRRVIDVRIATTLTVLSVLGFAAQVLGEGRDEALLLRFKNEAPIAWKKQVELRKKFFIETSGVAIDSNQKVVREGKVTQIDEYHEKRIRSNYRRIESVSIKKGERTLQCANPRYAFELASSSSGKWVITGIHPYQAPPPKDSDIRDPYNRIMEPPSAIHPHSLPIRGTWNRHDWIGEEVKVHGIKFISVGNREFVEVSVEFPFISYVQNGDAKGLVRKVDHFSGVGVFDPSNEWVLTSFIWMGLPPWRSTNTFAYDEKLGGVPFMTNTREESRNMTTNVVRDEIFYSPSATVAALSDRDFTLSAFGFPEPTLKETPYWFYSSLGGLVLVILGAVFYNWGARMRN